MHALQELIRLHRLGTPCRDVARLLGISPNTERPYRLALAQANLLSGDANELPTVESILDVVTPLQAVHPKWETQSSACAYMEEIHEMLRRGAKPKAIYDALKLKDPNFAVSLSAIKRLCKRLSKAAGVDPNSVAIVVDTPAGEVAQVDFGDIGMLLDPDTKTMRRAYVFVMVLGFSRHIFAKIVFDQKIETWLALHAEAFSSFGGVPRVVVPDNLKSAVLRAAFHGHDDITLNRSYRDFARFFGFKIDPAPAYSPEKKGKVESGVKYVKNNFFLPRKGNHDVRALNEELSRWVTNIAGQRLHGTTYQRPFEVFMRDERPALLSLPSQAWEPVIWTRAKLHTNCHVTVRGAQYSAPWRLVGRELLVRMTRHQIELYADDTRVATHAKAIQGQRRTLHEHLPDVRGDYRRRTRSFWEERADRMGHDVGHYIREVFDSDDVLLMLNRVQSIVTLLEKHPLHRAQAAARRASFYGNFKGTAIRDILRNGLDQEPLPTVCLPADGASLSHPKLARSVQELLPFTQGKSNAHH